MTTETKDPVARAFCFALCGACDPGDGPGGCHDSRDMGEEAMRLISALDAAGYAIVPKEPSLDQGLAAETETMVRARAEEAGDSATQDDMYQWPTYRVWFCVVAYRAMIAVGAVKP